MMPGDGLLDHDILSKVSCFGLATPMLRACAERQLGPQALAVAQYVLPAKIAKSKSIEAKSAAMEALSALFQSVSLIEPTNEELTLAAGLEERAQALDVDLDAGESQLLAVLISRNSELLLTGDKRAIKAVEVLSHDMELFPKTEERLACLEQLIMTLLSSLGMDQVRAGVCEEASVDKALAICFSCVAADVGSDSVVGGLQSYISHVRSIGPHVLRKCD